jgi:hypothetical protein
MNNIKLIILEILNEIEKKDTILTVAGGRGYSAGKAYSNKSVGVLRLLGYEEGEPESEEKEYEKVKVSKAFKKD